VIRRNEAARLLQREGAPGEAFESAFPLRYADSGDAFSLVPVLHGERLHGLQLCLHPEGSPTKYLLASAGPLTNEEGSVIGCVVTLTDFTEMRNVTAALMRTNAELEQFAFAAAHDLQEPLRMVSTYSQLLLRRYAANDNEQCRQFTAYIQKGVTRMQALLRDLLSYSKITNDGEAQDDLVDCNEVVRGAVQNCEQAIRESGALITLEDLPPVHGEKPEILEVFQNLISNAIKYSSPGPPQLRISARRGEREHRFAVQDHGIGIPKQYQERIFGLFKRLHGREYPGTGIGLAICKRVVEKHGGHIWVESEPGQGSTFYFTLPAQPRTARQGS
jgi:light-regulated signal transduction histidine kinase (bacteriophytochrome)